ncbi:MAG: hypothetical protein AB2L13_17975 [Spirochaetota bacterium]
MRLYGTIAIGAIITDYRTIVDRVNAIAIDAAVTDCRTIVDRVNAIVIGATITDCRTIIDRANAIVTIDHDNGMDMIGHDAIYFAC